MYLEIYSYYNIELIIVTFNEIILGTSPFIFAPQFGHRTRLYELDFEKQPENIAKILNRSYELGVHTIMLNRSEDLEKALDLSIGEGNDWNVIGKTSVEKFEEDLEIYQKYNTRSVMLDGFFVDERIEKKDYNILSDNLQSIRDYGYVPSIETRMPFKNLPIIKEASFYEDFDEIMLPLNFYGYMMDCNFLNNENKNIINELLASVDKKIIANRTLATGILQPKEAYEFIKNIEYLSSVCVGVAKVSEAEETFGIINSVKS